MEKTIKETIEETIASMEEMEHWFDELFALDLDDDTPKKEKDKNEECKRNDGTRTEN